MEAMKQTRQQVKQPRRVKQRPSRKEGSKTQRLRHKHDDDDDDDDDEYGPDTSAGAARHAFTMFTTAASFTTQRLFSNVEHRTTAMDVEQLAGNNTISLLIFGTRSVGGFPDGRQD